MFQYCSNTTDRGSVGEARAIYEFVRRGWVVSTPINDKAKYDLIVDDGVSLRKVQVKTTTKTTPSGGYEVRIESSYANRNESVRAPRDDTDYDALFVMSDSGDVWFIPAIDLGDARSSIVVGTAKWESYKW